MRELVKIVGYTWSLRSYYLGIAVLVVVVSALNQANPFILKFLVDGVVGRATGSTVSTAYFGWLLAALFAAGVLVALLTNVQGFIGDRLGARIHTLLSQRYYDHLLSLPLEFYDNEVTGRLTARLERSIAGISELMKAMANAFVGFFLSSAFTLIILARYSPLVAGLLALLFPVYIGLTQRTSRRWQAHQDSINADLDLANGRFVEAVGNIRVVKSFVQENAERRFFADRRRSVEAKTQIQSLEWHRNDMYRGLSLNAIFFFVYALIIGQALDGSFGPIEQSIGTVVLMLQLSLQAQMPLFTSSFVVDQVQRAAADSRDFFSVMEVAAAITDVDGATELEVDRGEVEFRGVSFNYSGGQEVLRDVSFTIDAGTKLALVGESGEGKTTVANLLLRFYEPTAGQILVDGVDIAGVTQASLRAAIGVVFQEPALFSGTVAANISYGRPDLSPEEMREAARAANAHDFIERLPRGYETEIGERGVKLSGGQRQRIAIARALVKNPPILVLDEATSSLDSKAEREVQQALSRLMEGRTTLIIAHRLSTIRDVDWIVSLRNGAVVEQGSPAELAEADGIYAELLALQDLGPANAAKLKTYDISGV